MGNNERYQVDAELEKLIKENGPDLVEQATNEILRLLDKEESDAAIKELLITELECYVKGEVALPSSVNDLRKEATDVTPDNIKKLGSENTAASRKSPAQKNTTTPAFNTAQKFKSLKKLVKEIVPKVLEKELKKAKATIKKRGKF